MIVQNFQGRRSCPANYYGAIRGVAEFDLGLGRIAQRLLGLYALALVSASHIFFLDTQRFNLCAK